MIDTLHLKAWWKPVMVVRQRSSSENMYLGLFRNRRTLRSAVKVDAIVRIQKRISSMGKTPSLLIWIEARGESVLLSRFQHQGLALEDQKFVSVQRIVDESKVSVCKVVQVDIPDLCTEIDVSSLAMVHEDDSSSAGFGMRQFEGVLLGDERHDELRARLEFCSCVYHDQQYDVCGCFGGDRGLDLNWWNLYILETT